jgi:hypothetical protein
VKRSQLRHIIKEAVKEILNEQTISPQFYQLCLCTEIDPNVPGGCIMTPQSGLWYYGNVTDAATGNLINAVVGDAVCINGLNNNGGCSFYNRSVIMDIDTPPSNPPPPTTLHHISSNQAVAWGCDASVFIPNATDGVSFSICDCQGPPNECGAWLSMLSWSGPIQCNGQVCTQQDVNQEFEWDLLNASNTTSTAVLKLTITGVGQPIYAPIMDGELFSSSCPVYGCTDPAATNFDPLATVDDGSCIYPGISIYACKCNIWQNNGGSCPPNGTGSNYLYTNQATTITGNPPVVGDTFSPAANTNFIIESLSTPTQPGSVNYWGGSPCNLPNPPATYDCYPGQGCLQNWSGTGQYSGGTSAQNLADCQNACQTTYDCDGAPNYNCDPNYSGTGQYSGGTSAQNLTACQTACVPAPPDTYDCDQSTWTCYINQTGTGQYSGGTSAQNLAGCSAACQPPPPADTYDCDQNYNCVVNASGTGTYSGGTSAQNYQDCQASCQAPNTGCADPNAPHCNTLPPQLQIGCYRPSHDGCGNPPNSSDTSCCRYQAHVDIDRDRDPVNGCADPSAVPCSQQPPALQNLPNCYDPNHDGCGGDPNDTSCCRYQVDIDRDRDPDVIDCPICCMPNWWWDYDHGHHQSQAHQFVIGGPGSPYYVIPPPGTSPLSTWNPCQCPPEYTQVHCSDVLSIINESLYSRFKRLANISKK